MTSRAAAAAVLAGALVSPSGALADTRTVADPVDERAAPLDIASIGHGHDARGRLVHRVTMHEPWRLGALRSGRGDLALLIDLDSELVRGHPRFERGVVVGVRNGRLYAEMQSVRGVLARVKVWRPNHRTVKVAFPNALLRRGLAEYHWFASTLVFRGGDAAPGTRMSSVPETLTHSLRGRLTG